MSPADTLPLLSGAAASVAPLADVPLAGLRSQLAAVPRAAVRKALLRAGKSLPPAEVPLIVEDDAGRLVIVSGHAELMAQHLVGRKTCLSRLVKR